MKQFTFKKSFTLLELLIVIAVLGILVSLLLPSLMKARESAKETVCMSNRAQHMIGVIQYTRDNDFSFPRSKGRPWRLEYTIGHGGGWMYLMGLTVPYNGEEVIHCPTINSSAFSGSVDGPRNQVVRRWISYNAAIWRHMGNNEPQKVYSTNEKAIMGDLIQNAGNLGKDHQRKIKNMAYIDGNVKRLREQQLKVMKTLSGIPSKGQYKPFWDSINDL